MNLLQKRSIYSFNNLYCLSTKGSKQFIRILRHESNKINPKSIKKITQFQVGFTHKETFNIDEKNVRKQYPYSVHNIIQKSFWKELSNTMLLYILPANYPVSVDKSYKSFAIWSNISVLLGSLKGVITTQSLLSALGYGTNSVYASAGLNWILKDGIGQIGGLLFAGLLSRKMDGDPQKWNIFSNIILCVSSFMELITPYFPSMFIFLGALANIGKNISCIAASASRSSVLRALCPPPYLPLGDLTAKAGSQAIASSITGTFLGIGLSLLIQNNTLLIWSLFSFCCVANIYSTYKSIQKLPLTTLNLSRMLYATQNVRNSYHTHCLNNNNDHFNINTDILTPEEVACQYPKNLFEMNKEMSIVYGQRFKTLLKASDLFSPIVIDDINTQFKTYNENYIIIGRRTQLNVYLTQKANAIDEIKSFLHISFLRERLINTQKPITKELFDQYYQLSYTDMYNCYNVFHSELIKKGWETKELYLDEQTRRLSIEY